MMNVEADSDSAVTPGSVPRLVARVRELRLRARVVSWRIGGGPAGLGAIEADVARDLPHVPQMTPAELAARLAGPDGPLVLDVRTLAEHAVSRIPGARLVSPGGRGEPLPATRERILVLVCSVGVRSALMASALIAGGRPGIWNLSGGIFRWHGEGRPIVDDHGPTRALHPYAPHWARFVQPAE